jgi:hypothetical protein
MAIPDAIKNNFHTLEKAFKQEDIALLECRDRPNFAAADTARLRRTVETQSICYESVFASVFFEPNSFHAFGDPKSFSIFSLRFFRLSAPDAQARVCARACRPGNLCLRWPSVR